MGTIKIKKGINLPINGKPRQEITQGKAVKKVALLGKDYVGLKPTMEVNVGDKVVTGQLLFTDKKQPGVKYTSPGTGRVVEINRGEKRAFLSIVIELEGDEQKTFPVSQTGPENLDAEKVKELLIDSGLWTSLRTRPFGHVANPDIQPHSIFVTAMDSNPLAPSVQVVLQGRETDFKKGLAVLTRLTEGQVYVCKYPQETIPTIDDSRVDVENFQGMHPAGLPGTHIHFLDPVGRKKTVWHINAQDVARIGVLFTTGKIDTELVVSLAGAGVKEPRLLKTRIGACMSELVDGELKDGKNRVITGSVFYGTMSTHETDYLGRYYQQVTVIPENQKREFLGWLDYGPRHFSVKRIVLSGFIPGRTFDFNTSINGGLRSIVASGSYEKMMPLDILPTYLLRALAVHDVEDSEKFGCLELVEEDLALCTFVCPAKIDHGVNLRETLTIIEKEG